MHARLCLCLCQLHKKPHSSLSHSLSVYLIQCSCDASNFSNEAHLCCGLDGWLLIIWCLMDFDGFNFGLIAHARAQHHITPTAHTLAFAVEKKCTTKRIANFVHRLHFAPCCMHSCTRTVAFDCCERHVAKSIPNYHSLVGICRLWMNMLCECVWMCAWDRLNCKRKARKRTSTPQSVRFM